MELDGMRSLLLTIAILWTQPVLSAGELRFGRQVIQHVERDNHQDAKLNDVQVPMLRGRKCDVTCLVYQDKARIYVEVEIKNRSDEELAIPKGFIELVQAERKSVRIDTTKVAEEIDAAALRPFVPSPTGTDPDTRAPVYDNDYVDEQVKAHVQVQARENLFANVLLTLAQQNVSLVLKPRREQVIACTFEQRKDRHAPFDLVVHIGGEDFTFKE